MKAVRKVVGMGMAALTDIAVGIVIVHLIGKVFGYNVPIYFYPFGVFLSLFPDIDYPYNLWYEWRKKKAHESHRKFPHYPIVTIPFICCVLGILSIFWPIFIYWTVVAAFCLLGHYIHDSIEGQLRWLAPVGKKYYGLFTEKDGKKHFISSFSEKEWEAKWEDERLIIKDDREYFETYYLRPTKKSVMGGVLIVIAILLVWLW